MALQENRRRFRESPLIFKCGGDDMVGVLHAPDSPNPIGVLIIVGGPQYRVGSHRHFVELARELASHGYAVFRFDYRGMGDSGGESRNFETVQRDLQAATDTFFDHVPSLRKYVAWGLCDAASAILLHVSVDEKLAGAVLLNPWVRQTDTLAQTTLSYYYGRQFVSRDAWRRVLLGKVAIGRSASAIFDGIKAKFTHRIKNTIRPSSHAKQTTDFRYAMLQALMDYQQPILILLSDSDMTAAEFRELCKVENRWAKAVSKPNIQLIEIANANHTFSTSTTKKEVNNCTLTFLARIAGDAC